MTNTATDKSLIDALAADDRIFVDDTSASGTTKSFTPAQMATFVGSSTTATLVTVEDEATDTTCFPLFVTAATGDLGPKSNTGLSFNSATAILAATGFSGPLTGNVTGNVSGTAATVTEAAQTAITSLGTLTTLTVDNITINGNTITADTGALNLTPAAGSAIVLDGTINVDAGVVTGATSVTSTAFVGALTGNADSSSTTDALESATTTVDVSAATAPTSGQVLTATSSTAATWQTVAGSGDVVGPASATDDALARFDSTTGKLIQNSTATLTDGGTLTATAFSGPLTGDVTGNADTATALETARLIGGESFDGTANINPNIVTDTSPQLGGFLDPNSNYIGWTKGGDIASASPLVIDTDGNYFDVTGTTGFAAMTVAADRIFMLHFDGILTMTDGASLSLPSGANITTAADDECICMATAANTVRVISYTRASGEALVGGGGVPTTITVADESTDTTCFPSFFTAATGDLGPKTNTNLTYNSSTGAFGIVGALTVDNLTVNGNTITADTGALNLTPAAGSAIVLDGTINVDAGVVTGATSVTSTTFVGALTGNADSSSTTDALESATTTVDVSSATAPIAGQVLTATGASAATWQTPGGGSGDVVGPASATDNAITRFDSTTGKLIQNSGASVDDSGNITGNNLSGTNTGDEVAATTSVAGISELATTAEVDTGTDTGRTITPDALAGSYAGTKEAQLQLATTLSLVTGDDKVRFQIPDSFGGMDLVRVHASLGTAGVTGSTTIQIHNITQAADMLSTVLTITSGSINSDGNEVIDTANDDVATNDQIRIDIDSVSTGTAPKGLFVTMEFRLP